MPTFWCPILMQMCCEHKNGPTSCTGVFDRTYAAIRLTVLAVHHVRLGGCPYALALMDFPHA